MTSSGCTGRRSCTKISTPDGGRRPASDDHRLEGARGSAADRPERALWLLDRPGGSCVKAAYDYSHFQLLGLTLEETLALMLPRTAIVHVKDVHGGEAKHDILLPGDGGAFDYADYFRRLGAGGGRALLPDPHAGVRPRASAGELGQRPGRSRIEA